MPSSVESSQVDFLIVGAGPVGLLAANLIVQAGFTVRILDIEYEPNHWGRGDWIHGRTLELLEKADLASELLNTGVKVEKMSSYMNGQLKSSLPFVPDEVESKHQYLLCVGQHITESSLQSQLSRTDVQVERPATVVQMKQSSNTDYPVRATVMHMQDAVTEEVECRYILGCDGAHSDIRSQLGIVNEGETTETHAGVVDALVRTNFGGRRDVCILQSEMAKTISLFPRENGLTRIFVHFNENEHDLRKEQHNRNKIQLEDIQREAKRALLPHRLEFLGILYWSVYVVGQRAAAEMDAFDGRVFLCGDAAHCQSPTLGQGINTGFGDIFNLIWKLCMIERGVLKREVTATYASERRPVALQVLSIDKTAAKAAAGNQSEDYCNTVEANRAFTTGFGIQYKDETGKNPLLWSPPSTEKELKLQAGMRAPDYKVIHYATGQKVRLSQYQSQTDVPSWLSFSFIILAGQLTATASEVEKVLTWINTASMPPWNVYVVTTTPSDAIASCKGAISEESIMLDKLNRSQCHQGYSHGQASEKNLTFVIIRPDGYIGSIHRQGTGDSGIQHIQEYFDRIMPVTIR
ncbi:FAD binding domain-containing protein [Radiomyces spectabilis]|uniref:FAD binding domain-containing protein n=1 Tax=Radiomyces spectabilis TaxID=64574 RepID=UPI0022201DA8|nr:FAD binding domain-containing protein [Radiomyces spectabilis]KAI8390815.1 FAD binding domain-containing protein [Radiomyces spectabilis]